MLFRPPLQTTMSQLSNNRVFGNRAAAPRRSSSGGGSSSSAPGRYTTVGRSGPRSKRRKTSPAPGSSENVSPAQQGMETFGQVRVCFICTESCVWLGMSLAGCDSFFSCACRRVLHFLRTRSPKKYPTGDALHVETTPICHSKKAGIAHVLNVNTHAKGVKWVPPESCGPHVSVGHHAW